MKCMQKPGRTQMKARCEQAGHIVGCLVFIFALTCALLQVYWSTRAQSEEDNATITLADNSTVDKYIDCDEGNVQPDVAVGQECEYDLAWQMKTFGIARGTSFAGTTTLVLVLKFLFKRYFSCCIFTGEVKKLKTTGRKPFTNSKGEILETTNKDGLVMYDDLPSKPEQFPCANICCVCASAKVAPHSA